MKKSYKTSFGVIHNAIKRHAGLTDFDNEAITAEVRAIFRALKRNGLEIEYRPTLKIQRKRFGGYG